MNFDSVWQLIRYSLLVLGGAAVGKGWISQEDVLAIVGAVGVIATTGWGLYVKAGTKAVPAATAARPDVPVVSAATGQVTS